MHSAATRRRRRRPHDPRVNALPECTLPHSHAHASRAVLASATVAPGGAAARCSTRHPPPPSRSPQFNTLPASAKPWLSLPCKPRRGAGTGAGRAAGRRRAAPLVHWELGATAGSWERMHACSSHGAASPTRRRGCSRPAAPLMRRIHRERNSGAMSPKRLPLLSLGRRSGGPGAASSTSRRGPPAVGRTGNARRPSHPATACRAR